MSERSIPYGYCHCGCGNHTRPNPRTQGGRKRGEYPDYLPGHNRRKSPVDYLVEDRGYVTPCWVWQLAKNHVGYGNKNTNRGNQCAHRWYYEQAKGPIPVGLALDHLCQLPSCVNPEHLEPITPTENKRRGRGTKLKDHHVKEIKRAHANGATKVELAARYGVRWNTIHAAVNRME